MCDHHASLPSRPGGALRHGEAHVRDHRAWNRRQFLAGMTAATVGGACWLGGTPVRALEASPLLRALQAGGTQRVLVLIQLSGGNDGLNTVVPITDDRYYNARPGLALAAGNTVALPGVADLALHPALADLPGFYGDGQLALLQNVGYGMPNRSHFRSTDIWLSASDSEDVVTTGWAGRYLDDRYPAFVDAPTPFPLAVQVGGGSSMLFQGPAADMGMTVASTDIFDRIVEDGSLYRTDTLPTTTYGAEMAFVREVANNAFRYAGAIQEAAQNQQNSVEYPAGNPLANNLATLARLIKGRLGTHIYLVSLGGFDTHVNQAGRHQTLLRYLSEGVRAFYDDLSADGLDQDVLTMTFSEFGRRVNQNAQNGTDHGTAAPLFLFGPAVQGGLYGRRPDLEDVDTVGDLKYDIDFRSVYATVLQDWFGLDAAVVDDVLGASPERLGFVAQPTATGTTPSETPTTFTLAQNYPNPFNPQTVIGFSLDRPAHVRLRVYDTRGRHVQTLVEGPRAAGAYEVPYDAGPLPSGTYFYRLETASGQTRQMTLVR